PLPHQVRVHLRQSGDIAAGARQALDDPGRHRVAGGCHNDRDIARPALGGQSIVGYGSDDDVYFALDQFSDELRQAIGFSLRIAVINKNGLALDPSQITEPSHERPVPEHCIGREKGRQKSYSGDYYWPLLRARRERPSGRHAAEKRDELAPLHVLLSARGLQPSTPL